MERCAVQQKKGLLSDAEIQKLVMEWKDVQGEAELDQTIINGEVKTMEMEAKLNKYNVPTLGEMLTQHDNRAFRILVCQMGGFSGKEVRELKIASVDRLIAKYKIKVSIFMELNYNWATVDSSANLASCLPRRKREKIGRSQQSSRDADQASIRRYRYGV